MPTESVVVVIIIVLSIVVGTVVVLAGLVKVYKCKPARKGEASHSEESKSTKVNAHVKTRTVDENEEEVALRESNGLTKTIDSLTLSPP